MTDQRQTSEAVRSTRSDRMNVTDEMVNRATLALTNELRRKAGLAPMLSLGPLEPSERDSFMGDMRIALEAALSLVSAGSTG